MTEKKGAAPLSREELERIRDGELAVTREQVRLTLCGDERGYAHDKSVRCDPPCEDCGSPHCAWTVLERQVRDLATTALSLMDERDCLRPYEDMANTHNCGDWLLHQLVIEQRDTAEAHIVRLKEAGQRLRDFVESGETSCGYSSATAWNHAIFGEDATRVVLAWDALLTERSAPKDAAKDTNDTERSENEKGGAPDG